MQFRDLPINATFQFTPSKDGFHHDRNVYRKVSMRQYHRMAEEPTEPIPEGKLGQLRVPYRFTVGTVNVEVVQC